MYSVNGNLIAAAAATVSTATVKAATVSATETTPTTLAVAVKTTATATTVKTTATAAAVKAGSWAFFARARFVYFKYTAFVLATVQAIDGRVCFFVAVHFNEAETTRFARDLVFDNHC